MIRANVQTVIIIKWVLLNYIKHFLIIQSLNSDRRLEQWTPCAGCFWLHISLAGWMHVLVCFTIMEHLNAPKMAAMQNGGFGNDYSCFKINIIVSFLFLCGCSLRSVCNNNWWMHAWAYKEKSKLNYFLGRISPPSSSQENASSVVLIYFLENNYYMHCESK